jgi:hypothetical protein
MILRGPPQKNGERKKKRRRREKNGDDTNKERRGETDQQCSIKKVEKGDENLKQAGTSESAVTHT